MASRMLRRPPAGRGSLVLYRLPDDQPPIDDERVLPGLIVDFASPREVSLRLLRKDRRDAAAAHAVPLLDEDRGTGHSCWFPAQPH
jgi:hypothetical protein